MKISDLAKNFYPALDKGSGPSMALNSVFTPTLGVGICMWTRSNYAPSLLALDPRVMQATACGSGTETPPTKSMAGSTATATGTS